MSIVVSIDSGLRSESSQRTSDKSRNLRWNSDVVSGFTGDTPRLISVRSVVVTHTAPCGAAFGMKAPDGAVSASPPRPINQKTTPCLSSALSGSKPHEEGEQGHDYSAREN